MIILIKHSLHVMLCFFLMNLECILHNRCIQVASQRCVRIQLALVRHGIEEAGMDGEGGEGNEAGTGERTGPSFEDREDRRI